MASVEVVVDQKSLQTVGQMLDGIKNGMPRAVSGAMNDLMKTARSRVVKGAAAEVTLKQKRIRQATKITRATPARLAAQLTVNAKRRPGLVAYGGKQTSKGVTYRISKKGKRQRIDGAFLGNGGKVAFRRKGKKRLPIVALRGPSVNKVIKTQQIDKQTQKVIEDKLPSRIMARAQLLLDRANR